MKDRRKSLHPVELASHLRTKHKKGEKVKRKNALKILPAELNPIKSAEKSVLVRYNSKIQVEHSIEQQLFAKSVKALNDHIQSTKHEV